VKGGIKTRAPAKKYLLLQIFDSASFYP